MKRDIRVASVAGSVALLALFAAGIVLAAAWLVALPEQVLLIAWIIAVFAMIAVAIAAGVESRRVGHGPLRTIRHMSGDLGRFVLWFF